MENQTFEKDQFLTFLNRKSIDAAAFEAAEPEIYSKWFTLFGLVHEDSFVMQQKFLINPIRRKYPKLKNQQKDLTTE